MKKDIKRAIINATVDRGLREIDEDPRRAIRKLTDFGRQFSKGRFLGAVYDVFQDLLRNDDSPYYTAIEHLLTHTDRKAIKEFGINMGYQSLTLGGKTIRGIQEKEKFCVPWSVKFRIGANRPDALNVRDLSELIAKCKKLGIFTYSIRMEGELSDLELLLSLMKTHDECAFILMLPDRELSEEICCGMKSVKNCMFFNLCNSEYCDHNSFLQRRNKILYGIYDYYDQESYTRITEPAFHKRFIDCESVFVLLVAKDGTPSEIREKTAATVKQLRLEPSVPLFYFDLYGDSLMVGELLSGQASYFEYCGREYFYTNRGGESIPGREPKELFHTLLPL